MGVFSDICTPHTRQVQLVQPYLCRHAVILQCLFCNALAYAITANGVCLHLLVPPLTQFFSGPTFQRRAKLHSKKGVAYFRD